MNETAQRIQYKGTALAIATKHSSVSDEWLVCLHGIGCAKECFDAVFNIGLAQQFSILTLDFAGFGASDKPDDFDYAMEDHAAIAQLVIEQFKPDKVVLVAHSMGGAVGVLLARRLSNLVSLVSAEGNLVPEDAGITSRKTAEQTEAGFVREGFGREGFGRFLHNLKTADDPSLRTWAGWYEQSSKIAIYRSGRSLVEWSDSGKLLEYFNALPKKAYLYGDRTDCSALLEQLDHADMFPIPQGGHFMMLDNPQAFYAAIAEHLAR